MTEDGYDDTFWAEVKEASAAHVAMEAERRRLDALEEWRRTCPSEFEQADWESVLAREPAHPPAVLAPLEAWCASPGPSLVLMGSLGTGKTHLACAVAHRLVSTLGVWATFSSVEAMMAALQEGFRSGEPSRGAATLGTYSQPGLLVLDDLASGRLMPTEWEAKVLNELFNRRWSSGKSTVVTSNLSMAAAGPGEVFEDPSQVASVRDLRSYVGERTYDRLRDGSAIVLVGQSLRGRRAPARCSGDLGTR